MKRVMVIDALNLYLRAYVVDPSLSSNGQPIGGIKGSLKILQKLTRMIKPDEIVFAWDGPDGSRKRKIVDSNYKAGRKPIRLNRSVRNLTEDEELQNRVWQQTRLIEYLNNMPIIQLMLPEVEADDIVSYIVQMPDYKEWQKVIVSNDKDFLQLCDDETIVYRPTKDEIMTKDSVVETFGVHPTNMALARSIIGDTSDNLPGVRGVGFGKVKKNLLFLAEEDTATIDEVIEYCENSDSKLKFFQSMQESKDIIEHNYKMMQLYCPLISIQGKQKIDYAVKEFDCAFNKTALIKMMREDSFGELNWEELKAFLNKISLDCKEK